MIQLYRENPLKKHAKLIILAGLGCIGLIFAIVCLIYAFRGTDVPDVDSADPESIAEFVNSDSFLEMNSRDRSEYADRLMKRFSYMTPEQRAQFGNAFGRLDQPNPKAGQTLMISFMTKKAREYQELPPEKRDEYIDNQLMLFEKVVGPDRMKKNWEDAKQRQRSTRKHDPDKVRSRLQTAFRNTSAEDRATMSRSLADVTRRLRERYGD